MKFSGFLAGLAAMALVLQACTATSQHSAAEVEGLWVSTEETSSLFAPGADRVALQLRVDSAGMLTARGLFLKNQEYHMEWKLGRAEYDPAASRLSILDADGDTLICVLDKESGALKGAIHVQDESPLPLDFIPAGPFLENRLFHPRPPAEDGTVSYTYSVPEQLDDGLVTGSVFEHLADPSAFQALMEEVIGQEFGKMKSLLILKDNTLLVEEYYYAYGRDDLQQIRSCTKSITSLMLGMALDRHPEVDLEQSIFDFFPQYRHLASGGREDISLRDVLSMQAGMEWVDYPAELFTSEDGFAYILSRPMAGRPGQSFLYNSGCSVLLGGVIEFLEKTPALDYAEEHLFEPLGIREFSWEHHRNKVLQCGHGLSLRPRDMAKIGLLALNEGKWQDRQLVSEEWIHASTRARVRESDYFHYGYHWWNHSGADLQWWTDPHAPSPEEHEVVHAMGHGGQYIMLVRDLNLVMVTTASDFNDDDMAFSKIPMAVERIIPFFEGR